jgi:hypothetical protein
MKYKFPDSLIVDYHPLKEFVDEGQEISKDELLERSAGNIPITLLQAVKELEFDFIGKSADELYLR